MSSEIGEVEHVNTQFLRVPPAPAARPGAGFYVHAVVMIATIATIPTLLVLSVIPDDISQWLTPLACLGLLAFVTYVAVTAVAMYEEECDEASDQDRY